MKEGPKLLSATFTHERARLRRRRQRSTLRSSDRRICCILLSNPSSRPKCHRGCSNQKSSGRSYFFSSGEQTAATCILFPKGTQVCTVLGSLVLTRVWQNQPLHNFVVPEKLSCLDVDSNAIWCAAGSSSGRIYLWEVASGALFKSFAAHYRAVTVLRFHSDGDTFVTGSDDSSISIWSIPRCAPITMSDPLNMPSNVPHVKNS